MLDGLSDHGMQDLNSLHSKTKELFLGEFENRCGGFALANTEDEVKRTSENISAWLRSLGLENHDFYRFRTALQDVEIRRSQQIMTQDVAINTMESSGLPE